MATLESQYDSYKRNNPDSTFTFEEWKSWLGENLKEAFRKFEEEQKNNEEDDKQHRDN